MISSAQYSSSFLFFLQYIDALGLGIGVGVFGMVFPSQFLRQLCPMFSESDVIDHPVTHMMTRMFW
jgi:hypothetical protein